MKGFCFNNIETVIYIELILLFYELINYKKRSIKDTNKEKLESLLEIFAAVLVVLSYIILGKAKDSGNFTTNYRVERSLCKNKVLEVLR